MKLKHIVSNPKILGGKPIIDGTRISVEMILEWISTGGTPKSISEKYPQLSETAVREAIVYASRFMKNEITIEIKKVA